MRPLSAVFLLIVFSVFSCQVANNRPGAPLVKANKVLFVVDDDTVTTEGFLYAFKKNNINRDSAYTLNEAQEYLDLYIKFKLKIAEAKNQGIDTTASYLNEFKTYSAQLKKPYLTDNKIKDQLVKEAYGRYKQEVKAAHLLIRLPENPTPADTLKAYSKIMEVRKKVIEGGDFGELAMEYSEDPSAKDNKGDLGYFTSMQMVYPFESAAYNTPKGEVSDIIRTRFGYHILKVQDKRPANGTVEVSHLMLRPNPNDSVAVRNKIFEIYDQAIGGVSWGQLVKQFSEDVNSKNRGGKLQPFTVGRMPLAFQEAAFALENPGDISDPVLTPYGWHIIKLVKKQPVKSFEQLKPLIESRVKQDVRAEINKNAMVNRLKSENGYSENSTLAQAIDRGHNLSSYDPAEWLITVGDEKFKLQDFVLFKEKYEQLGNPATFEKFVSEKVIQYEEGHLEDKYFDYHMLLNEYREGIMLFQLMEEEVWSKAAKDSAGLTGFYQKNKNDYMWKGRAKASIYSAQSDDIIEEIKKLIEADDSVALSKEEFMQQYNTDSQLALQVEEGLYEKGENEMIGKVNWQEGIYETRQNNRSVLIVVREILPAAVKPLEDIRGLVISDYQNYLEEIWVENLRNKYKVTVNEQALGTIYEQLDIK